MSNLVPRNDPELPLLELAEILWKSGLFPDTKSQHQAVAKILAGRELGLGPIASLRGIDIIGGKLVPAAGTLAALVKSRNSGYDYKIIAHDDSLCRIEFFRGEESLGISEYTIVDAQRAGVATKDVWKKFPRNLLFARALSNGVKWYTPDVCDGSVYAAEEMEPLQVESVELPPDPPMPALEAPAAEVEAPEPVAEKPKRTRAKKEKPELDADAVMAEARAKLDAARAAEAVTNVVEAFPGTEIVEAEVVEDALTPAPEQIALDEETRDLYRNTVVDICKEVGLSMADLKTLIKREFGKEGSGDLDVAEWEKLIGLLDEAAKQAKEASNAPANA